MTLSDLIRKLQKMEQNGQGEEEVLVSVEDITDHGHVEVVDVFDMGQPVLILQC